MAVHDGEPHLQESLESILGQRLSDLELIVVDDGSTDATWSILQDYKDSDRRMVLLRNPENRGLIFSLNHGMEHVRAPLVARMDADDIADRQRLQEQVRFLDDNPDIGVLGTGYYRLHADRRRTRHTPPLDHTTIRWRLLFGNIWPHPAMVFRRHLLTESEPVYDDFLHAEDYELWTRLARRTRTATLSEPLMTIRTHDSRGISAKHRTDQLQMVAEISRRELSLLWPQPDGPSARQVEALRALSDPGLSAIPYLSHAREMLALFDAFARQPGLDRAVILRLRRSWIRRTLRVAGRAGGLRELGRSGFIGKAVRRDPLALLLPFAT